MTNGQTYYYHTDALGSVIAITDSNRNVVQRYEYDSFGNIVSVLDPNFIQPYTYTAREYDSESGLYYYRARYYDAEVGRFISEDPIGFDGGDVNFYVYAGNNPINEIDPLGLMGVKPPPPSLGDFIPPTKLCEPPEDYCHKEYNKKKKACGVNPNAGCLEKARRWFIQCMTWVNAIIYKEIECPPCK